MTLAEFQLDPHQHPASNENYLITCVCTKTGYFLHIDQYIQVHSSVPGSEVISQSTGKCITGMNIRWKGK